MQWAKECVGGEKVKGVTVSNIWAVQRTDRGAGGRQHQRKLIFYLIVHFVSFYFTLKMRMA